jgi:hypothetical protein
MKKWAVLMTTEQYVEVEAKTPAEAEMVAFKIYKQGGVIPEYPLFVCEEADLIEEEGEDD